MNIVRRWLDTMQDSPTYGRDRANLISSFTIGITALLLNGVILLALLPVMLDPNDRDIRMLTERIEFGQLLGLVLLGGVTLFATLLIPLRLATVFIGPRIGRYFDQIVLSGISPLRFLIGRVTSQNLFLALILFLLIPWFVLVLSLGGLQWHIFLACLFLVWLYCMMLALVTLWLSLYFSEAVAVPLLIGGAGFLCGFGCIPIPFQPFVVTPFPAMMHQVYAAMSVDGFEAPGGFGMSFILCAIGMGTVAVAALMAIQLGPLYGIIRENSTFGEVVRAGDSKRKRFARFRPHIQRPSELAFFYENRSDNFRRWEGLLRWGTAFAGIVVAAGVAWSITVWVTSMTIRQAAGGGMLWSWWAIESHVTFLVMHGLTLLVAVVLFSHPKNSTFLRLPVCFGRKVAVARLDTIGFGLIWLLSTAASIAVPRAIERFVAAPVNLTLFPPTIEGYVSTNLNLPGYSVEATLVLSVVGLTLYALQRAVCLSTWMRSIGAIGMVAFYGGAFIALPVFAKELAWELSMRRGMEEGVAIGTLNMIERLSPIGVLDLTSRVVGSDSLPHVNYLLFAVAHIIVIVVSLSRIRTVSRKLRPEYLLPGEGGGR